MVTVIKEQQVSRRGVSGPDERRARLRILDSDTEKRVVERASRPREYPDPSAGQVLTAQQPRTRRDSLLHLASSRGVGARPERSAGVLLPAPVTIRTSARVAPADAQEARHDHTASIPKTPGPAWPLVLRVNDPGMIAIGALCLIGLLLLLAVGRQGMDDGITSLVPPPEAGSHLLGEATESWALGFRERSLPAPVSGPDAYQAIRFQTYTVAAGDTLSQIASAHQVNLGTLVSLNGIQDARTLSIGSEIRIPDRDGLFHVVQRGESLGLIARRYGSSINALLDANDLDSMTIVIGQQLFVPEARMDGFELDLILGRAFAYPARGVFTSGFGNRIDPFTGEWRLHNGIDIASRVGTPIVAANSGRVVHIERQLGNYGRLIIIEHGSGYQTLYAHLDRFAVAVGDRVSRGQVIGYMGNTGRSTGPHLHFAIVRNGRFVDPMQFLANR